MWNYKAAALYSWFTAGFTRTYSCNVHMHFQCLYDGAAFERLTTALVLKWQKLRWTLTLQRHVQTSTRSECLCRNENMIQLAIISLSCNWEGLCSLWGMNFINLHLEVTMRPRNPSTDQNDQRLLWLFFSPRTIFQSVPKHSVALLASAAPLPFLSSSKCKLFLWRPPDCLRLTRVIIKRLIKNLWPLSVQCYRPLLRLFLHFGFFLSQQQQFSNTRQT